MSILSDPRFTARGPEPRPYSPQELLFANTVHAAELAHRAGLPVTVDTILSQGIMLEADRVRELVTLPKFQRAMDDRGIPRASNSPLTGQQLAALAIYFDMSVPGTHAQKLRAAGVTQRMWTGWRRDPKFEQELKVLAGEVVEQSKEVGKLKLAQLVEEGNLKAIEFVFEMTGVHDRRGQPVDIKALLMTIYTILDDSGVAPEVMSQIAARLRTALDGGLSPAPMVLQAVPAKEAED